MFSIFIKSAPNELRATIDLPGSKSISNRVLIIRELCSDKFDITNLSTSQDTVDLQSCLGNREEEIFAGEGAAVARFLLGYYFIKQEKKTIHVSEGLKKRLLKDLIEALQLLGATFKFHDREYSFPLTIETQNIIEINEIGIPTERSSQFLSALLLIAPLLQQGLIIHCSDLIVSKPYINMTVKLMKYFGADIQWNEGSIQITHIPYKAKEFEVEADWSSASFIFCLAAQMKDGAIRINALKKSGLQADEIIIKYIQSWGVQAIEESNAITLMRTEQKIPTNLEMDFMDNPDLFPPLFILCLIHKVKSVFKNVQNLKYKESDRLKELIQFAKGMNAKIFLEMNTPFEHLYLNPEKISIPEKLIVSAKQDHRLAMAYSLFSFVTKIEISDAESVKKSFPNYWQILEKFGFDIRIKSEN